MTNTIQNWYQKIKKHPKRVVDDLFLILIIFLVGLAAFGLGRLSISEGGRGSVQIIYPEGYETVAETPQGEVEGVSTGAFVASISGTKYHLPHCSGARNIKEENKIWFDSREDAERAGYEPAANCPGL